jgi:transcriptional regulator with XRE-family HTH domain
MGRPPLTDAEKASALTMGLFLRERREKQALTQEDIARAAGTTHGTISELELGKKPGTSFLVIRRIAEALGFGLDELANALKEASK